MEPGAGGHGEGVPEPGHHHYRIHHHYHHRNHILHHCCLVLSAFLYQATMVNAWDQMLIKNGAKIVSLNESVAAVRTDQQRLEHELDFVASQVSNRF